MFITFPSYAFPMPAGLVDPDAQHWRIMQLTLHAPWFLLSVEVKDPESDVTFVRTLCFTWVNDLVEFLPTIDPKSVKGLVCMAPGWKSATGTWTSHEVRQIWVATAADGRQIRLNGADGEVLDVGLGSDTCPPEAEATLLLDVKRRRHALRTSRRKPTRARAA